MWTMLLTWILLVTLMVLMSNASLFHPWRQPTQRQLGRQIVIVSLNISAAIVIVFLLLMPPVLSPDSPRKDGSSIPKTTGSSAKHSPDWSSLALATSMFWMSLTETRR